MCVWCVNKQKPSTVIVTSVLTYSAGIITVTGTLKTGPFSGDVTSYALICAEETKARMNFLFPKNSKIVFMNIRGSEDL